MILDTLSDAPFAVANAGRPWIRTTYQLAATIPAPPDALDQMLFAARECAILWAKERVPEPLTLAAFAADSFSLEWPGQTAEAIAIPESGLWSFRLEQPDVPVGGAPAAHGRTCTTDIGFAKGADGIAVGVRVFCSPVPYDGDAEITFSRPGIILDLADKLGLYDQRPLSREPWLPKSDDELEQLRRLLTCHERLLPVVALAAGNSADVAGEYAFDTRLLANRLCGLAHVVQLPRDAAARWSALVGAAWSMHPGAVRTYLPGLDFENDLPPLHPANEADEIAAWKLAEDERIGAGPYVDFLTRRLFEIGAFRRVAWSNVSFICEARTKVAEAARVRAGETADWRQLFEDEIASLNAKIAELERESEEHSDDALRTSRERDQLLSDNRNLRFQLDALRQAFSERGGAPVETEESFPTDYGELPAWVDRRLTGRLVLHSRALRGLKDATFSDPALVCKTLLMLANEYRHVCLGREGAKDAFDRALTELGLRYDRSISKERVGEQGEAYFVRYPASGGGKRFLEWHVRKGSAKDDRFCLAIYFFWDDATRQVVVGWLPSHLTTRQS